MEIDLLNIGKRFGKEWIFKNLSYKIDSGSKLAIVGSNGSGKSTLLKVIGTYTIPSQGHIAFFEGEKQIANDEVQLRIAFAAPYQHLIEELTIAELFQFHSTFRKPKMLLDEMPELINLPSTKPIMDFSSGMKQRVRLALAFLFESDLILLDEPSSNLDRAGIAWYQQLLENYTFNRTIIVASNVEEEYAQCKDQIRMESVKP